MPTDVSLSSLSDWYTQSIAGSALWSAIGFGVCALVILIVLAMILRQVFKAFRAVSRLMAKRRRRDAQGYGLSLAPLAGAKSGKTTAALVKSIETDLAEFCFGAPYEIVSAPAPKVRGKLGLRDVARRWLENSATDLVVWGHRDSGKAAPFKLDILSREGSLSAEEAVYSRVQLPADYAKASPAIRTCGAYLVARALLPGLAQATTFRAEKLAPVAAHLATFLEEAEALPAETALLIERDYCAMALHIGTEAHLQSVVSLRTARLSAPGHLATSEQISARIDLGRALLAISEIKFDPKRIRSAMDHLKIAVELLRGDPSIRLATETTAAVQKGQAMLQARRRFSVTGGGI
ncbi:MAG: hypothetical protein QNI84_04510 [Henriciella sp.]|nr:hypothetical protein [Henriciella sp.]